MNSEYNVQVVSYTQESLIGFVAGVNGGIASVCVSQPLDTVKVKMQAFPEHYKNSWLCLKQTWFKDGLSRGLYAGTVPALMANIAENAVVFCALPFCQRMVSWAMKTGGTENLSTPHHALSGSLAGVFTAIVLCPTELVKCKMQAVHDVEKLGRIKLRASSPYQILKQILYSEGLRGLYRGFVPTLGREVIGYYFFFGGYEAARSLLTPRGQTKDDLGPLATAVAGGFGGAALWVSIFPLDSVKSRIQIGCTSSAPSTGRARPIVTGLFSTLVHIARTEGRNHTHTAPHKFAEI
uniref:Mitochondrial ornithine transporter 1 n=1 Tax=Schistocephalus solidus TaxID=70667 RepID=A0A0X3PU88_SCHSO